LQNVLKSAIGKLYRSNKRRGIGAGGSIGGIGGALAGSAQTALSLAIRSGIQASMVGTYMQSAFLPTSSATSSGRELGVNRVRSNSVNKSGANDKYVRKLQEKVYNEANEKPEKQNSGDATPGPRDKRIGGISGATPYGVSQQWGLPYHPQYVTKTSELFEVKEGAYLIVNPRNNEDKMVLLNNQGVQISEIRPFKTENSYRFNLQPFIDNGSLLNNQFYLQVTPLEYLSIYSIDIYEPYIPTMPSFR